MATAAGVFLTSQLGGKHNRLELRRGQKRTVVQDFGLNHPEWQVLGLTFDGRYAAYRVDHSYSSFDDFSIWLWDSKTRAKPREIAHGERDANGDLMPTPFVDPLLARGYLIWTQTKNQDPTRTVMTAYRLSDGRKRVLSRGYGKIPIRFGTLLLWPDAEEAKTRTSLKAIDLKTLKRAELPEPLRAAVGTYYLAGSDDYVAWVNGPRDARDLWVWHRDWPEPRQVLDDGDGGGAQFPGLATHHVVWAGSNAMYAADLRTWTYSKLTPKYGSVSAGGDAYISVGYAPKKKANPISIQTVIDTRDLPTFDRKSC